mmetsp:Transcript_69911/g.62686  ORF Transcript_69911/g.62686 Transcript_69911/m.62686 type:complete len:153 (-) Transcript_69911:189-647(-)
MAEGWAKYCLAELNRKWPDSKETNVGMAATGYDIYYYGYQLLNEGTKTINGDKYYVCGYNLKSGTKPAVSATQFEADCRMAVYIASMCSLCWSREPTAKEVVDIIKAFGDYNSTYISVIKLGSNSKGHVKVGKNWQYHIEKKGHVWYFCIAS